MRSGKALAEAKALELVKGRYGSVSTGKKLVVDPAVLARDQGASVKEEPLKELSGMLIRPRSGRTVIVVNSADAETRRRFTIAHELGHLLLHPPSEVYADRFGRTVGVNERGEKAARGTDLFEVQANAFAASLLMPEPWVLPAFEASARRDDQVDHLAHRFNVSPAAMKNRLIRLGLLSQGGWDW
jgi:predicted transcriptional regulator